MNLNCSELPVIAKARASAIEALRPHAPLVLFDWMLLSVGLRFRELYAHGQALPTHPGL